MERFAPRPDAASLSPFLAALCLIGSGLTALFSILFGFTTQAAGPGGILVLVALSVGLRLSPALRDRPGLTVPIDALFASIAIVDMMIILPWQAQAFALPLADETVRNFDRALGFEHVAWMGWLNSHPLTLDLLTQTYRSMVPQVLAAIMLCLAAGRTRHLDRYLSAVWIALILTTGLSVLIPTRGIVAFLDPALRDTAAWPGGATDVVVYDALRSGALRNLGGIPKLGIISFPSFHAAVAVLSIWVFWTWPPLRALALVWNTAMSIATVGCGGHYVADVLAGHLVAAISVVLAIHGSDAGYAVLARVTRTLDAARRCLPRPVR